MNSLDLELSESLPDQPKSVGTATGSPPSRGRTSEKLPAIQMLRGVAAVMVVFHHLAITVAGHNRHPSWLVNVRLPLVGAAGVDIFFVISGFIMFYTTSHKSGLTDAKTFLRKRALRIYPLYWFWTSVLLLIAMSKLVPTNHSHSVGFFVSSYLLIPDFNGLDFHPFLDQGWTLSFEMLFYCIFALGLWLNRLESILTFLTASFIGLFLFSLLLPAGSGVKYLLSNTLIIEFLFGVGLAKLFLRINEDAARKPTPPWLPVVLTALGCALLLSTAFTHTSAALLTSSPWRIALWGIPSALIVFGFATWNQKVTLPALIYVGDASYSTYLAHIFFLAAFRLALERSSALRSLPADPEIIGLAVLAVLLTLPAYEWVERPLTSWLQLAPSRKLPV